MRANFLSCLSLGIVLINLGCSSPADKTSDHPYPVQAILNAPSPYPYPLPVITGQANKNIGPALASDIITPVPASKEMLTEAWENFGYFHQEFPFINNVEEPPYRRYYGCVNSQNAGGMIDYFVTTQTSENIKTALIEHFNKHKIKHTDWDELDVSGFLGYAWKISAYYHPEIDNDATVFIQIDLLEYKLRATSEQLKTTPTEIMGIPKSALRLWINYIEKPGQFKGYLEPDLLKTCEGGWWFAQNP